MQKFFPNGIRESQLGSMFQQESDDRDVPAVRCKKLAATDLHCPCLYPHPTQSRV